MKMAIKDSKLNIDDINYINAHGTSTPLGDEIEFNSVSEIFGKSKREIIYVFNQIFYRTFAWSIWSGRINLFNFNDKK